MNQVIKGVGLGFPEWFEARQHVRFEDAVESGGKV